MALTGQAKTDYQRDYMRRRRAKLAQSARLDSQPRSPLPDDEQAALLEQNKELVERTTRVTRERDRALQELEVAQRGAQPPKPVGPDARPGYDARLAARPPHPDPFPASGAREQRRRSHLS